MEFRTSPHVHGVAGGLQETFDLTDKVYSYLVYGLNVPVTEDGEVASDMSDAVAILSIGSPAMPGGVPYPIVHTVPDDEYPMSIRENAEDLSTMETVSFYDDEAEETRIGEVIDTDEEDQEVKVVVENDIDGEVSDAEVVTVSTDTDYDTVTINGEDIDKDAYTMMNENDEHKKDWWRIEQIEEKL